MPGVIFEFSCVLSRPINPFQLPLAMFPIVDPITFILDPVRPDVQAEAIYLIVFELAWVHSAIWTGQPALARLLTHCKLAMISWTVRESFFTLPVRFLITPLSFVKRSIWILTDALAVQQVVDPVTLVLCAIWMEIGAMAMSLAHGPIAEVVRLVFLLTETKAVLLLFCHFSDINWTALRGDSWISVLRVH